MLPVQRRNILGRVRFPGVHDRTGQEIGQPLVERPGLVDLARVEHRDPREGLRVLVAQDGQRQEIQNHVLVSPPPASRDLENGPDQFGTIPKKVYEIKMIRLGGKGYRAKGTGRVARWIAELKEENG